MRMIRSMALIALAMAAPVALSAQDAAPRHGAHGEHHRAGPRAGRMDPFARLLEKRQELGLTAEQVSRIEAIRSRLQARNQPLVERMQAARREAGVPERREARGGERPRPTEEQRTAMRQLRDRIRPLAEQVRTNTRAAMEEARAVLTEQQQAQVREWHQEHRRGGRRQGRRGS